MMKHTTHSVGKVLFHLRGAQTDKVFTQRQQAAAYLQGGFADLLQQVFDETVGADELLYIPQLNIELKESFTSTDIHKLDAAIKQQLTATLQKELKEKKKYLKDDLLVVNDDAAHTATINEWLAVHVWSFFLHNGYFPNYVNTALWKERLSWFEKAKSDNATALRLFFLEQLSNETKLIRFLSNEKKAVQDFVLETIHPQFWFLFQKVFGFIPEAPFQKDVHPKFHFLLNSNIIRDESIFISEVNITEQFIEQEKIIQQPNEKKEEVKMHATPKKKTEKETAIIIANAGIVLLQPFIPQLFSVLKITDAERKIIIDQPKACRLLSFLAGDVEEEETLYPLYKILCGLRPDEFIPLQTTNLTEPEQEECTVLLQQVIKHWSALKATSTSTLQQTFFQRTGKLSKNENQWLLQVEQKTEDVLLQFLPWSYSVIRYPWMPQPLFTEWM